MRLFRLIFMLAAGLHFAALAQNSTVPAQRKPEEFGFRHLVVMFGKDSVDVLVQSPKGQEFDKKPVLFWAQGSLPRPVIMYDDRGTFGTFAFLSEQAQLDCHIVIVGKPGIPLVADAGTLAPGHNYVDKSTGIPPLYYCQRNYLEYYVRRNEAVLRYLKKQPWVDKNRVVVGGHSEGSRIVAHLAAMPGLVSRAVYLSGSPLGRELTKLARDPADSTGTAAEMQFAQWQHAVDHPKQNDCTPGDSYQNLYSFGQSDLPFLFKSRVPIFIGYGTRDAGAVANDYLRLEAIRLHKNNFTFRPYVGREHNFFSFKDEKVNRDDWYWEKVGDDFLRWAGLLPVSK